MTLSWGIEAPPMAHLRDSGERSDQAHQPHGARQVGADDVGQPVCSQVDPTDADPDGQAHRQDERDGP